MNIPDRCFSLNNMTINPKTKVGEVIRIQALETGYYPTSLLGTQEQIDEMNKELGVTKAEAEAMETASMFGWQAYEPTLKTFQRKFDNELSEA